MPTVSRCIRYTQTQHTFCILLVQQTGLIDDSNLQMSCRTCPSKPDRDILSTPSPLFLAERHGSQCRKDGCENFAVDGPSHVTLSKLMRKGQKGYLGGPQMTPVPVYIIFYHYTCIYSSLQLTSTLNGENLHHFLDVPRLETNLVILHILHSDFRFVLLCPLQWCYMGGS